jgi:hypothetical protein
MRSYIILLPGNKKKLRIRDRAITRSIDHRSISMDHTNRQSTDDDVVSAFFGRKSEKGPLDLSAHHAPHSTILKKIQ